MKIEAGDSVKTLLKLLSVNGEEVPPGSGEQTIHKTVVVGKLYKEALNNFISSEVQNLGEKKSKLYNLSGDVFFGTHRKDLICKIPRENMDKDIQEGEVIQNKKGNVGYIVDTKNHKEYISVDFNHPFSGKELEIELKISEIFPLKDQVLETPCGKRV